MNEIIVLLMLLGVATLMSLAALLVAVGRMIYRSWELRMPNRIRKLNS